MTFQACIMSRADAEPARREGCPRSAGLPAHGRTVSNMRSISIWFILCPLTRT